MIDSDLYILQVLASGGPQPESTVEFAIKNITVGAISQNGVIEAKVIGQTLIGARAVGFDSQSRHVIYSQVDSVLLLLKFHH